MHRTKVTAVIMGLLLTASTALAAVPTVKTFTVPTSAVSPIPVSAFTATDIDGTVTGYMITESSTKPSATSSSWSATPPTSYTTTKTGSVTLYAWAKDNAAGVSAAKTATTTLVSRHTHNQSDVVGLQASLDAKANASEIAIAYSKKYANVIVVARNGGDFTDPDEAMRSISDASSTNPYLLKIMPGVYDLGGRRLYMKEYVDVEGAGENTTIITGSSYVTYPSMAGTITGANNAELRNLTVKNVGANPGSAFYFCAIGNNGVSPKISHVTAISEGAAGYIAGICSMNSSAVITDVKAIATADSGPNNAWAIYDYDSRTTLRNVVADAVATGGHISLGIAANGPNSQGITMTNVSVTSTGGSNVYGMDITVPATIMNSSVTATQGESETNALRILGAKPVTLTNITASAKSSQGSIYSIYGNWQPLIIERSTIDGDIYNGGYPLKIAASKLNGTINGDQNTCVASYDGNFAPLNASCQQQ